MLGFLTGAMVFIITPKPADILLWSSIVVGVVAGVLLTVQEVRYLRRRRQRKTIIQPTTNVMYHCPLPACQYETEKDGVCPEYYTLLKARTRENRPTP